MAMGLWQSLGLCSALTMTSWASKLERKYLATGKGWWVPLPGALSSPLPHFVIFTLPRGGLGKVFTFLSLRRCVRKQAFFDMKGFIVPAWHLEILLSSLNEAPLGSCSHQKAWLGLKVAQAQGWKINSPQGCLRVLTIWQLEHESKWPQRAQGGSCNDFMTYRGHTPPAPPDPIGCSQLYSVWKELHKSRNERRWDSWWAILEAGYYPQGMRDLPSGRIFFVNSSCVYPVFAMS